MNINDVREKSYELFCKIDLNNKPISNDKFLMMFIVEMSKAVSANKKFNLANVKGYKAIYKHKTRSIKSDNYVNIKAFNNEINNSVEDRLASAAIVLFNLVSNKDMNIEDISDRDIISYSEHFFTHKNFDEAVYEICITPISWTYEASCDFKTCISMTLSALFGFTRSLNIDLLWFINERIKYDNYLYSSRDGMMI